MDAAPAVVAGGVGAAAGGVGVGQQPHLSLSIPRLGVLLFGHRLER